MLKISSVFYLEKGANFSKKSAEYWDQFLVFNTKIRYQLKTVIHWAAEDTIFCWLSS